MAAIHLFGQLLSCEPDLLGIDDDDVITRIEKGHIGGLILAGKQSGHPARQVALTPGPRHPARANYSDFVLSRYVALHSTPNYMTSLKNNPLG